MICWGTHAPCPRCYVSAIFFLSQILSVSAFQEIKIRIISVEGYGKHGKEIEIKETMIYNLALIVYANIDFTVLK